ncbi:hypothetical protein ACFW04_011397 [Cataglyphis niger]
MPNTRSQCSNTPSETNEILTQSDLETLNQKLNEKERMLKEHAKMLQIKQDELKNLQREIEQSRNANSDNNQYESIIKNLNEQISALVSLPEQMEQLNQRINDIQFSNQPHNQQTNYNSDYYSAQNFPRRSSPADTASPIRLKDVVDSIPKYNRHKIPVFYFSKMCERSLELIPGYHEYHLVQLIINKLQGHAYAAIEGTEYHTVFELTRKLKRIFGPNKSVDQYRGELANIYMKPNENIFDYIERVKELRAAIIDGETDAGGYIDEITKDNIERSVTTSFINGFPSDLLIRVKLEGSYVTSCQKSQFLFSFFFFSLK